MPPLPSVPEHRPPGSFARDLRAVPPVFWLIAVALLALLVLMFRVPISWMLDRWNAPDSYYSHGYLVPFVALWLVWRDRARLAALPRQAAWLGLTVLLVGLLLLIVSGIQVVFSTGALAMLLVIWGTVGFIYGRRVMLAIWFPMLVLAFMIPMPEIIIARISFKMKMLATAAALQVLNGTGLLAINDGSTIFLGDATVTVGDACSGLRSLISLIFLGLLFAFLSGLPAWRRVILFLASLPIAIIANIVRVYVLCLIAYRYGNESIIGWVHDASGYLIFIVAFALLYAVYRLLTMGTGDPSPPAAPASPEAGIPQQPAAGPLNRPTGEGSHA